MNQPEDKYELVFGIYSHVDVLKDVARRIELGHPDTEDYDYVRTDEELLSRGFRAGQLKRRLYVNERVSGDALARAGFNVIR